MEEYLNKLVASGYDFVICAAAGNCDNTEFVKDNSETYWYKLPTTKEMIDSSVTRVKGGVLAEYGYNLAAIDAKTDVIYKVITYC